MMNGIGSLMLGFDTSATSRHVHSTVAMGRIDTTIIHPVPGGLT
jgi:hypothetical protein